MTEWFTQSGEEAVYAQGPSFSTPRKDRILLLQGDCAGHTPQSAVGSRQFSCEVLGTLALVLLSCQLSAT